MLTVEELHKYLKDEELGRVIKKAYIVFNDNEKFIYGHGHTNKTRKLKDKEKEDNSE
jgi:hypothetical protein